MNLYNLMNNLHLLNTSNLYISQNNHKINVREKTHEGGESQCLLLLFFFLKKKERKIIIFFL